MTASAIAFYATSATIIPVLFLAFAVQGRTWQAMLRDAAFVGWHAPKNGRRGILILAHLPVAAAYLVLFAGLYGLGMSIGPLSYNSDDPLRHGTVLAAVIILNLAVVGLPLTQWWRSLWTIWSSARPESDDDQASSASPAA